MVVDGKAIAENILNNLPANESKKVCFISFNPTPESSSFIAAKSRVAKRLGIAVSIRHETGLSTREAIERINQASQEGFDGIVVQLPLSAGMDTEKILNSIPTKLDIDLLGEEAKLAYKEGKTQRVPPVAGAVEEILKFHEVTMEGKNIVILGKGRLVGEPVAMLFEKLGLKYKTLDIATPAEEIEEALKKADLIISGIGVPHFIMPEMIKEGVVLIDAGTSESEGELRGDADPSCVELASLITPVPGGVGPVTVAALLSNLFRE